MLRRKSKKNNNRTNRATNSVSATGSSLVRSLPNTRNYTQFYNSAPVLQTFATYGVIGSQAITFTPSSTMQKLFDKYTLDEVKVTIYFLPGQGNAASAAGSIMCAPMAMCYDPSGDDSSLLTIQQNVMQYHNAERFALTSYVPEFSYTIKRPTRNVVGSTGRMSAREPCPTEAAWSSGSIYDCTLYPSTASAVFGNGYSVGMVIQYKATYSEPRSY